MPNTYRFMVNNFFQSFYRLSETILPVVFDVFHARKHKLFCLRRCLRMQKAMASQLWALPGFSQGQPIMWGDPRNDLADLTVSKRPGTGYPIEIHFAVAIHLYLLFSFVKLVETDWLSLTKKIINLLEIYKQGKLYFVRNLIIWIKKWISIRQLVPVLFRAFRSIG